MLKKHLLKVTVVLLCTVLFTGHLWAQSEYGIINSGEVINKGVALHDEEKYDEALALYNQVPGNDTNYTLALVEKAFTYYAKKDYTNTIKLCEQALSYGTEYDNNLYITLASAYDDAEKSEKAIEVYDRALQVFPKNHLLLFNKAVTFEKLERFTEALDLYKQVLKITPYHATTHYRLGHIAELEGDLTRAMLCYNTFLIVEPSSERAFSVLQSLDNMVNRKYDDSKAKGIKLSENREDFSEIETLIRKQLALNKNYKLESKADFPITRQNQALLSYLATYKGSKGFWETFYVPFYAQIYKQGYFEGFSYSILASSDNEKIKSLLSKNKRDVEKFTAWEVDAYSNATSKRKMDIDGKVTDVLQLYYKSGSLYGVGPYYTDADKTDKKTGGWKFYYAGGRLMSTGNYDNNGQQTDDWKFYHTNGKLKKETKLAEGNGAGPYKLYRSNGNLQESGTYAAGELDGEIKVFNWYGGLEEVHHFKDGKHEGKYEEYYANGKLSFSSNYVADKLTGIFKSYHPDGKPNVEGNVKDNLKEGVFTAYFRDGKTELKKSYVQNKEDGPFIKYYNNGKLKQEGTFKSGNPVGAWKLYFLNGQLDEITTYNDAGNENGTQQYFDIDGKQYYQAEYKDGRLLSYSYTGKDGKVLTDTKLKTKQEAKTYYSNGSLRWTGYVENGKRSGQWKEYARNGLQIGEYNYVDGSLNGTAKTYFYNGKVHKELNYKNGSLQGEYLEYFRNGKLYQSSWYENGNGFGDVTIYNTLGLKSRFYTLSDDKIVGKNYNYNAEGKLDAIEEYENGKLSALTFFDTSAQEIRKIAIDKEKVEAELTSVAGNVVMKRTFINGSKEGQSNCYFLDNKLQLEGAFLNDKREGLWKWYNPDNTTNSLRAYRIGQLEGTGENYDLFGNIRSRFQYSNGNTYGVGELFYYNGSKKEEMNYWDDELHGATKYFGFNGEHVMSIIYEYGTMTQVVYINGKAGKPDTVAAPLTGTIEAKYANGKTAFILDYKNGYQHGRYSEFYEDGSSCRQSNYVDDQLEGERKIWYRNGNLRSTETFKFDDNEGITTLYNENGTKKAEITYKSDVLHGPVKYYDAAGKLIAHFIFYNNDMIKKVL